ncbi:MAG TPA: hypothetical protein PKM27_05145 [Saprospiraceae bacterium]|nr:hypothetical protein [Saprospiraceae bacterium]HNT20779.1 hypothetical protein [Saprospiraceae bacterium]
MKEEQDYLRDITEIRSMMERSSKFLSLSGWSGILAGIYALAGAYIAYSFLGFNPADLEYRQVPGEILNFDLWKIVVLALIILILAVGTAIYFSQQKAHKRGERIWNATTRRLLAHMAVPLIAGGLLILILISKGWLGLMAPLTLLFYGLALYHISRFTYDELKTLGLIEMVLGLAGAYFIEYGLLFWALGFGLAHVLYGIFIHYRYER